MGCEVGFTPQGLQAAGAGGHREIYFSSGPEPSETQVREVMKAPGGRLVMDALELIGKFPAQEVSANLHRFKQLMETGRVTDTTYAVSGKFPNS